MGNPAKRLGQPPPESRDIGEKGCGFWPKKSAENGSKKGGAAPKKIDAALPERGSPFFTEVDCGGRLLLPGLSDAHVHVTAASTADLAGLLSLSESLVTARALVQLEQMLMRGFTTVRDVVRAAAPFPALPSLN